MKKEKKIIILNILVFITLIIAIVIYSKVQLNKKRVDILKKQQYNMIVPDKKQISAQELITMINRAEDINRRILQTEEEISEEHKQKLEEKKVKQNEEKKPNTENENIYFPKLKNKKINIEIQIKNEEYVAGKGVSKHLTITPESILEKGYYKFLEVFGNVLFEIREIRYDNKGLVTYIRVRAMEE